MPLSLLDIAALIWFVVLLVTFDLVTVHSKYANRSLSEGVARQRRKWLQQMVERDQRHFDAILMASLSQSNAFFASTSVLGIGGLAAVMGSGETARQMFEKLPLTAATSQALWEIKILFLISILIYAFFKFAWAFRLSHYSVIMFGAMGPCKDEATRKSCLQHGVLAARLLDLVGQHANNGLRSFYYAFAALSWLFHPLLFILAMTLVFAILLRREFMSRASAIITEASLLTNEPMSKS